MHVIPGIVKSLRHPIAIAIAGLLFFAFVRYMDTRWRFLPYTFMVTGALAAILYLMSRRPLFSLYTAGFTIALLSLASMVKFKLKGVALHAFDFVFVGGDTAIIRFLFTYYTPLVLGAAALLAVAIVVLVLLFRNEARVEFPVWLRGGLATTVSSATLIVYPVTKPTEADFLPFIAGYNASAPILSLWHVPSLARELPLAEQIRKAPKAEAFARQQSCDRTRSRPDFVYVLAESQTSPDRFDAIDMPQEIRDSFRSGDGKIRDLTVEIFGGGTWMSSFSALTGLSTADLGWQGPYVNQLLESRIKEALPEFLANCGYRTVAIMPMEYHSVNEGPFLKSIGFKEIYDSRHLGVPAMETRDHVYYRFAQRLMEEHRASGDERPLFIMLQSMFTHAPYMMGLVDDGEVAGHQFSRNPEVDEYMRRVAVSRTDLMAFLTYVASKPGTRGTVVATYGDHQSVATSGLLKVGPRNGALADFRSEAYKSYYSVHGFGVPIDYEKLPADVDIGFLAAHILAAADMPASGIFDDLLALSKRCGGIYHLCVDRSFIDQHLYRRMEADLLLL